MRMDEGIDTGDMILRKEVVLREDETGGSLFERLAKEGADLCVKTLEMIEQGTAVYTPQNHEEATYTTMMKKKLGEIVWTKSAQELERLIRGLDPWPSAYTYLDGKTLKIWRAAVKEHIAVTEHCDARERQPGTIVGVTKSAIEVQTGQGILSLEELQLEGKRRMTADAFLRGFSLEIGKKLG